VSADGQRRTLVLDNGVLTFDGEVVEAFGFAYFDRSVRVHVAKLERVDVDGGGRFTTPSVTFHSGRTSGPLSASFDAEQADEVAAFVQAVQAAAPGLEAG
jgi:hypothetical protein